MVKANVDKIIEALKDKKTLSTGELSKTLSISKDDVQKSAEYLEEDGIVKLEHKFPKTFVTLVKDKSTEEKTATEQAAYGHNEDIIKNKPILLEESSNDKAEPLKPVLPPISASDDKEFLPPVVKEPSGIKPESKPALEKPPMPPPPMKTDLPTNNEPDESAYQPPGLKSEEPPLINLEKQDDSITNNTESKPASEEKITDSPEPPITLNQTSNLSEENKFSGPPENISTENLPIEEEQLSDQTTNIQQSDSSDPLEVNSPRLSIDPPDPSFEANKEIQTETVNEMNIESVKSKKQENLVIESNEPKILESEDKETSLQSFPDYAKDPIDKIEYMIESVNKKITSNDYSNLNSDYRNLHNLYHNSELNSNEKYLLGDKLNKLFQRIKRIYLIENIAK